MHSPPPAPAMIPLAGMLLPAVALTEHDDPALCAGQIGRPVFTPSALLADLELRLGLSRAMVSEAVRVQAWSRRLAALQLARPRFYSASYAVDPLGTATTLLAMRDELVAAGWSGAAIPNGGERLHTFVQLEASATLPALPIGAADRLRRVEDELAAVALQPYAELRLAESAAIWPGRWQRIFARLEGLGVTVRQAPVVFAPSTSSPDSDLRRVQARLRGEAHDTPSALKGDGSLLVLRAETSLELAAAVASLVAQWNEPSTAIVRGGESYVLDAALVAQGLPSIGVSSSSASRPVAQVLPLAVGLAFEPRDPYRVLELLTLPIGPFEGRIGRELASALTVAPGIGGPPWEEAKQRIADFSAQDAPSKLGRIAAWLEAPGARDGAARCALLDVAIRVRSWLQARLAHETTKDPASPRIEALRAAFAQAQAFHEALSHDPREQLDRVDARLLVEQVSGPSQTSLSTEQAGRLDPVDAPAGLRAARETVIWWHCVSGTEWRPAARPWRRAELEALDAAGVALSDPAARLSAEAHAWRQVVLAARTRLVLAIPRSACGASLEPHPIWDEITARLGARDAVVSPVLVETRALLAGLRSPCSVETIALPALSLPEARTEWHLDGSQLAPSDRTSASGIAALVGCPLSWVFTYRAGLRAGSIASLPRGPLLNGSLGHRLVECLHTEGGLHAGDLAARIEQSLERLLRQEAAVLLRAGMTFELAQLRRQLASSVTALAELLAASHLTIADVESEVSVAWRGGTLEGRLDLLLQDAQQREVILDLKWGAKSYREALEGGKAVQLAVYAAARQLATGAKTMPPTGYFTLAGGKVFTLHDDVFAGARPLAGPPLDALWRSLERTIERVQASLARGRVPVTGVAPLRLLEVLGVHEAQRDNHFEPEQEAACTYCEYGALCGRAWRVLA